MNASRTSCVSFVFAIILPVFGLIIGWMAWGFQAGVITAVATFVLFLVVGGVSLAMIKDLSWFMVAMPFLAGVAYVVFPDLLPLLPFDDAAAMVAGSLGTLALAIRKDPNAPRGMVVPLLAGAIYTLFGALIPGPVDELLVLLITGGASALTVQRGSGTRPQIIDHDQPDDPTRTKQLTSRPDR